MIKNWLGLKVRTDLTEVKDGEYLLTAAEESPGTIDAKTLVKLAKNKMADLSPTLILVAGTLGKEETREAIKIILSQKHKVFSASGNDVVSLAQSIINDFDLKDKVLVSDFDLKNRGVFELFSPDILVITSIDQTGLQNFDALKEDITGAAFALETQKKGSVALLNADDKNIERLRKAGACTKVFFSGTSSAQLYASDSSSGITGLSFMLNVSMQGIAAGRVKMNTPLLGLHHLNTALASSGVAILCQLSLTQIKEGLSMVNPLPGRLNILRGLGSSVLIDDSASSSFASVVAASEFLKSIEAPRKVVVLGDMKDSNEEQYRIVGEEFAVAGADLFVAVGELANASADAFAVSSITYNRNHRICRYKDVDSSLADIENVIRAQNTDVILVKGSKEQGFPKLAHKLILDKSQVTL